MDDSNNLKQCLLQIEEQLQWGKRALWTNSDFKNLSELIHKSSGILISINTLRRLFGKMKTYKDYYNPQIETKNALAQFLNYNDWQSFKQSNKNIPTTEVGKETTKLPYRTEKVTKDLRWKYVLLILVFLLASSFLIYRFKDSLSITSPKLVSKFSFKGFFLEGNHPLQVEIDYDVTQLTADSIYIDFGNGTLALKNKSKGLLHRDYTEPNVYKVKLVADGRELSSLSVVVKTNGWQPSISFGGDSYFAIDSSVLNASKGRLHFPPNDLKLYILGQGQGYWIDYRNIKDYNVDADNFRLEARIKNSVGDGGLICYDAICEIQGTEQKITSFFIEKGCKRWVKLQIGEKHLTGEKDNLKSFEQDLSMYRNIKIEVRHKKVNIYVDTNLIYTGSYTLSAGTVKGLVFRFRGNGSVDFVNLYNGIGKLVYQEDFD